MRAPAFCWMMPPSSWPYLSNGTPVGGTSIECWIHRQKPARLPFAHPRAPPQPKIHQTQADPPFPRRPCTKGIPESWWNTVFRESHAHAATLDPPKWTRSGSQDGPVQWGFPNLVRTPFSPNRMPTLPLWTHQMDPFGFPRRPCTKGDSRILVERRFPRIACQQIGRAHV